MIRSVVLLLRR